MAGHTEIILMLVVFILYFIVPLIPAIIIYKIFPDTRVVANGRFKTLNFKTTGAFGAYVVALTAGVFIVNKTMDMIQASFEAQGDKVDYLWHVKAKFKIIQDDSTVLNSIAQNEILDNICVALDPPPKWYRNSEDGYIVYVPNSLIKNDVTIGYSASECETKKLNPTSAQYKKDPVTRTIDVGEIVIRRKKEKTTYNTALVAQPVSSPQKGFVQAKIDTSQ